MAAPSARLHDDTAALPTLRRFLLVILLLGMLGILSIPGLGQRMLHEFKEYRPYNNIERFRREIGKYVYDREVARLERYVTLD